MRRLLYGLHFLCTCQLCMTIPEGVYLIAVTYESIACDLEPVCCNKLLYISLPLMTVLRNGIVLHMICGMIVSMALSCENSNSSNICLVGMICCVYLLSLKDYMLLTSLWSLGILLNFYFKNFLCRLLCHTIVTSVTMLNICDYFHTNKWIQL